MTDLEKLSAFMKQHRMDKKHEDWGFPRGWNEAFDFVEGQILKIGEAKTAQSDHRD